MIFIWFANKVKIFLDPCPANFTRVARNCYHFSERQYNWKSAASMCKSLGSNLIEIESKDEFMEVVTYIQASSHLRGKIIHLWYPYYCKLSYDK